MLRVLLLAAFALSACQCGTPTAIPTATAAQWPEADAIFRTDPRWIGSDAAYSVPLGGDRTLWLFGDTFVAKTTKNVRSESKMVRNTLAIQTGLDPTTASLKFHWRDGPASFFPDLTDRWLWPLGGARVGDTLVLFFSHIKGTPGQGLGFAGDGWRAAVIDNPDAEPADWHVKMVTPANPAKGITVGTAVMAHGDFVFALSAAEGNDHAGFLARWKSADFAAGNLDAIEWWNGTAYAATTTPKPVMGNAGPECSLHFDGRLKKFVHVRTEGFGKSTIAVSFADKPEGPWSPHREVFRPPENDKENAFVYAAKAHPQLAGADLVVTYASNTFADFSVLVGDTSIYFPRFVKLTLKP